MKAQRFWDEVQPGDELAPAVYPLSVMRLVMAAGANRDFNSIHHNAEFARASGAPDMYANTFFLQGMWERCVRAHIGDAGTLRSLSGFAMTAFNIAGQTATVRAHVVRKWMENGEGLIEIAIHTHNGERTSVGPGTVVAALPLRLRA